MRGRRGRSARRPSAADGEESPRPRRPEHRPFAGVSARSPASRRRRTPSSRQHDRRRSSSPMSARCPPEDALHHVRGHRQPPLRDHLSVGHARPGERESASPASRQRLAATRPASASSRSSAIPAIRHHPPPLPLPQPPFRYRLHDASITPSPRRHSSSPSRTIQPCSPHLPPAPPRQHPTASPHPPPAPPPHPTHHPPPPPPASPGKRHRRPRSAPRSRGPLPPAHRR